jgi:ribosomal-protein-alanine N-acetyltransferase
MAQDHWRTFGDSRDDPRTSILIDKRLNSNHIFSAATNRTMPSPLTLETERFVLRPPLKKDIPSIIKHMESPSISANTLQIPFPYSRKDAMIWVTKSKQEIVKRLSYTFCIIHKKSNNMIGVISLHMNTDHNRAEAGYWIAEPHWNKGMATEALVRIMEFGFKEVGLNKILATHLVENPSSGRVMIKAGMIREGKLRDHFLKGAKYITVIQYAMTASAYDKLQSKKRK